MRMFKFVIYSIDNGIDYVQSENKWMVRLPARIMQSALNFCLKSESIRFIESADPLKLLLKSAIQWKFFWQIRRSADPLTLPALGILLISNLHHIYRIPGARYI